MFGWKSLEHQLQTRPHAPVATIGLGEVVERSRPRIKTGGRDGSELLVVKNIESVQASFKPDALANSERFEEAHIKVHGPLSMLSVTSNRGQAGHNQGRSGIRSNLNRKHVVAGNTATACGGREFRAAKSAGAQSIDYSARVVGLAGISDVRTIGAGLAVTISIQAVYQSKRRAGLNNRNAGNSPTAGDLAQPSLSRSGNLPDVINRHAM